MHILYTGPISLDIITKELPLGEVFRDETFRFDLGSRLVLEFHKAGHKITVLKLTDLVARPVMFTCERFELKLYPDRSVREQYRHFYHKEVVVLSKAIMEAAPDVILATWTYQFARAALLSGYPTLVVAHDSPWRILCAMRDKARFLRTFYSQFLVFPKIRYLAAVSPYIVEDVRKYNLYWRKVRCIPNAIWKSTGGNCSIPREDADTIVCVTEWSALKNPMCFFRAWNILKGRLPRIKAIVYGRGIEWEGPAGRFIRSEGISCDGLELMGYKSREEIDECLSGVADMFVSTTLEESFGLIFLEAMSKGVPCIGGNRSGAVPWVLGIGEEDVSGLVCNLKNPKDVAQCMERLFNDYILRKKLSANGVRRVSNRFSLEACVSGYLDALESVANSGRGW